MLWSEIDYDFQVKIIQKIYELLLKEEDPQMRKYLVAAAYELEVWSNTPCDVVSDEIVLSEDEYISYAQDNYLESKSDSILSILFGKK